MTRRILTIRISRRAMGAAVLDGESLTLVDGRHLTSRRERAAIAATRYAERLLDLAKPDGVVLDIPQVTSHDSDAVSAAVAALARHRRLDVVVIGKAEVLNAYGARPLRTRAQLRQIVCGFWPDLARITGHVQPYVADAAAAALYAESRLALRPSPP